MSESLYFKCILFKWFIKIFYFSIDAGVANRMCNFVAEFDIENKGLNTLCRASWLLDHDMFEVYLLSLIYFILVNLYFY